jgi:hypothetical protein
MLASRRLSNQENNRNNYERRRRECAGYLEQQRLFDQVSIKTSIQTAKTPV